MEETITNKMQRSKSFQKNVLRRRTYHHVYNGREEVTGTTGFTFDVTTTEIESEDIFKDELILLSFPIEYLNNIDSILEHFNLENNADFFIEQCKDVIAVSENHQSESGGGKMSFQAFFHNIPESICSVNDTAIVVLAINPDANPKTEKLPVGYHIAGYIHANIFDFKPYPNSDLIEKGYYYNLLRVSEREENGEKIYRRMRIFSLMFSILLSLTEQNDVKFAFACMGKENEIVKAALHSILIQYNMHYEFLPFTIFSKINRISGSKKYSEQIVEITHNELMLKKMYKMVHEKMSRYLFYNHLTEDFFLDVIKKIVAYSKSSGVFMIPDQNGEIAAAAIAMNYGDYFVFKIKNPKGIFRLIAATKIMEHFLRLLLGVGEHERFDKLFKGLSYKYHKEHKIGVSFLPTFQGDPYYSVYKSLIDDKYLFFIICHDKDYLQELKRLSEDDNGNTRLFIDHPIT